MKCVLLTGGSGAIGSALVPLLLREPDTTVRLLLRAANEDHLCERLVRLRAFWDAEDLPLDRLEVLCGDVCQPSLGLAAADHERLSREVTHIVHAAGTVKLNQTLEEARRHALTGVRQVVALSRACQAHGQFRKLDALSTVGVAGRRRGLVLERPMTQPRLFRNTYEAAKAEAEQLLLAEMAAGLPATIHRPSMVVGAAQTGRVIHFQVFYHLSEFLLGTRSGGFVPDTGDLRLDIVPADYVARLLQLSVDDDRTIGKIFHHCSGPAQALRMTDLAERLRELARSAGRHVPRCRRVHPRWFRALIPILGPWCIGRAGRALRTLPHFLAYLDDPQVFDNSAAQSFGATYGLEVPPVDDYLAAVMAYFWDARANPGPTALNLAKV